MHLQIGFATKGGLAHLRGQTLTQNPAEGVNNNNNHNNSKNTNNNEISD